MPVFMEQYSLGIAICGHLGSYVVAFIVHTLCRYSGVVATAVGNKFSLQAIGLKACKSRVRVQQLSTNKYIPLVSCDSTFRHCLLKCMSI